MPDIGAVNSAYLDAIQTWLAAQTFKDSLVKILNPAGTFSYLIVASAIGADRSLTLPLITGNDTLVVLNLAQIFTDFQTIKRDSAVMLKLYRDNSSTGQGAELVFSHKNSTPSQVDTGTLRYETTDNAAGSEDAFLSIKNIIAGTLTEIARFTETGKLRCGGANTRIELDETGLSARRPFTFPDTSGQVKVPSYEVLDIEDEFSGGLMSSTANQSHIGALAWGTSFVGVPTSVMVAGVANHLGIYGILTGATSGDMVRLHLGDNATRAFCIASDLEKIVWIVRIPTITSIEIRIGIGQDISSTTFGTAGAWFSFVPATSAFWQTITREASTSTTNTTSVTVTANNWYVLEIRRLSGGNWEFYVNETLVFTHSANQPTTACAVGLHCKTVTAGARNLDVDYFRLRSKRLGQRWT